MITSYFYYSILFFGVFSCSAQNNVPIQESHNSNLEEARLFGAVNSDEYEADTILKIKSFVNTMFEDSKGTLWVGTYGDGLIKYNETGTKTIQINNDFKYEYVNDISEDGNGLLWLATSIGLIKYDGESFDFMMKNINLESIFIDSSNHIWLGSKDGAYRFDKDDYTKLNFPNVGNVNVNNITSDSKGNIWFATSMGAFVLKKGEIEYFDNKGFASKDVNDIHEDREGRLWFASSKKGIAFYENNEFQLMELNGRNDTTAVSYICEDIEGDIWFPVEGLGVHRYNGSKAINIFEQQGCISHTFRYVLQDNKGRVWFGGGFGLYVYKPIGLIKEG